ncbi:hypothetical protein [Kitasatospora viridis]|uniref:Uncharacterized protein n=1 Tax=Kitasatospora viridis TaxID=281105 RepID=A0A561SA29_9ACTN|nr:hypothetical protein [Kitasatospora viridis]TWF71707.1 hypothetical protein FHX73_1878 [Kitasatospora viridis]
MIDITGLDRAEVLAALFNEAGLGGGGGQVALVYAAMGAVPEDVPVEQARRWLEQVPDGQFEYVAARPLKVDLRPGATEFDGWLFDREHGQGAAQRAVDRVRGRRQS